MSSACILFLINILGIDIFLEIFTPMRRFLHHSETNEQCMCYMGTTPGHNRNILIPKVRASTSYTPKRDGPPKEDID